LQSIETEAPQSGADLCYKAPNVQLNIGDVSLSA